MNRFGLTLLCLAGAVLLTRVAAATKSAELYTGEAYPYGRFEARMRVTAGDGVVSAFFLWKDGSEMAGTFWNELDFEKIGANCQLQTNALYGNPAANHTQKPAVSSDLCAGFHIYGCEWTADYIAWSLDGMEIRRETGEAAAAFAQNASAMQIHFNIWPGDASFGGNFSPSILPVHQYIDWVQYSSYANGAFTVAWREDFSGSTAPSGWLTGDWGSPKNLSTHDPLNVNFLSGYAVLSLTADDATGPAGAMSGPDVATGGAGGTSGGGGVAGAAAGTSAGGGAGNNGGVANLGGSTGMSAGGTMVAGGVAGNTGVGGQAATPAPGGVGGAGAVSATGGSATNSGGTAVTQAGTVGTTGGVSAGGMRALGGNPAVGGALATAGESAGNAAGSGADDGCSFRALGSSRSSQRETGISAALALALAGAFWRRRSSRGRLNS